MNTVTARHLAASLLLVGALNACTASKAPDADKPALLAGQPVAAATAPSSAAEAIEAPTQIPGSASGIWQAIDQKTAQLHSTIQSGSLSDVHHIAFAVRDLVAGLPAYSGTLPAEQQEKVRAAVKFVATLAERLDASGDAKDVPATQANYEKLMAVLASLRSNYPDAASK